MRKLLILLLLPIVAFLSMGAASSAAVDVAAPVVHAAPVQSLPLAVDDDSDYDQSERDEQYAKSWYQPSNRWSDMSMHSRVDWWNPVLAGNIVASRATQGSLLSIGNGIWGTAADWARSATSFDPLSGVLGYQVDKITGIIGTALMDNPIIFAVIFAFAIALSIWTSMRRPGSKTFLKVIQAALIYALIAFLATQSAKSTEGAMGATYEPLKGTPVWIASTVTKTVDVAAGALVSSAVTGLANMDTGGGTPSAGWSCDRMFWAGMQLTEEYSKPTPGTKAVTVAMSSMWKRTALASYASMQFGDSNPWAKNVACHQLERLTEADPYTKVVMLSKATDRSAFAPLTDHGLVSLTQPLLQSVSDGETNDRVQVALAACSPSTDGTFKVRAAWKKKANGDDWIKPEDCKNMWAAADTAAANAITAFDVKNVDQAREFTNDARIINFIGTLQGSDAVISAAGIVVGVTYLLGSLIAGLIFGLVGIGIMGSKIAMVFMVALLIVLLVATLFIIRRAFSDVMSTPAKRFMTVTLFSFGASLIIGVIALVSLIISNLGTMFGPDGTPGNLLWIALSPLGAVICLHFIFTKGLKLPSPVTPAGAFAWGTAGGAVGGAVVAGLGSRVGNAAKNTAGRLGKEALGSNKATSWMVSKDHRKPDLRQGAGDAGERTRKKDNKLDNTLNAAGNDIASKSILHGSGQPSDSANPHGAVEARNGAADDAKRIGEGETPNASPAVIMSQAAEKAAQEATEGMSPEEIRQLEKEARRADKLANPGMLTRGVKNLQSRIAARNDERIGALLAGEDVQMDELLSDSGRERLSMVNREEGTLAGLDEFASAGSAGAIAWADLSNAGKAEAMKRAAAARRDARDARVLAKAEKHDERAAERVANADSRRELREQRREQMRELRENTTFSDRARVSADIIEARLTDSAKAVAKGTKAGVNRGASAVKAAVVSSADGVKSLGTVEGRLNARDALVTASKKTAETTRASVQKTRQVAQRGRDIAQRGRELSKSGWGTSAALGAGVGIAALGNPIVGGVIVAKAAKTGVRQIRETRAASRLQQRTRQLEYIATAARARQVEAEPRTSTVSPLPAVAASPNDERDE